MTTTTDRSTVSSSPGTHAFIWTVFPLGGALLGWLAAQAPGWIAGLPWFPNQAKIAELAGIIGLKTTLVLIAIGVLAGGVLVFLSYAEMVAVTVGRGSITVRHQDGTAEFDGHAVAGAFLDKKELVLLGTGGEELAREKSDLSPARLRAAFQEHGFAWHEQDPHRERFTRWIDGSSALAPDVHAILRTRQTALDGDDATDQRELRAELAKHGVFVRDQGKRQYWRGLPRA